MRLGWKDWNGRNDSIVQIGWAGNKANVGLVVQATGWSRGLACGQVRSEGRGTNGLPPGGKQISFGMSRAFRSEPMAVASLKRDN